MGKIDNKYKYLLKMLHQKYIWYYIGFILLNMYLAIILLPFLGSLLSGLWGRALGVRGSYIINVGCLLITTLLAFIAFFEVAICKSTTSIELFSWVSSEILRINWSFYFDELTVSMLIPVVIVSLLVHLYSVGYMGEDPHVQRFFSYISLFTGLMIILVTADNYLVMFVGWEGSDKYLKWYGILKICFIYLTLFIFFIHFNINIKNKNKYLLYLFYCFIIINFLKLFKLWKAFLYRSICLYLFQISGAEQRYIFLWEPAEIFIFWLYLLILWWKTLIIICTFFYDNNIYSYFPYFIIIKNRLSFLLLLENKKGYPFYLRESRIVRFSNLTLCIIFDILLYLWSNYNIGIFPKGASAENYRSDQLIIQFNYQNIIYSKNIINNTILNKKGQGQDQARDVFLFKMRTSTRMMISPSILKRIRNFSSLSNNFYSLDKCNNNKTVRRVLAHERIGPHNIDIVSIIVGSTLGDAHLERRRRGKGTRIIFEQCNKNIEYLLWFHKYLSDRGYCSNKVPKLKKRISGKGKILFHYRINSYTFTSFNWLHDMFYTLDNLKGKYTKVIPLNLEKYLTPLALAIWFMDDGSICGSSVKIATNCFTDDEILFLCDLLKRKYDILCSKVKDNKKGSGIRNQIMSSLYIYKRSLPHFSKIVKPYMVPSMYYKLNGY